MAQLIPVPTGYQELLGYMHVFTPSTINVAHVGFNYLHRAKFGSVMDCKLEAHLWIA